MDDGRWTTKDDPLTGDPRYASSIVSRLPSIVRNNCATIAVLHDLAYPALVLGSRCGWLETRRKTSPMSRFVIRPRKRFPSTTGRAPSLLSDNRCCTTTISSFGETGTMSVNMTWLTGRSGPWRATRHF